MGIPIDILIVALSMRSPSDVTGRAFNHAPDSLQDVARKRALCIGLDESVNSVSAIEDTDCIPCLLMMGSSISGGLFLTPLGPCSKSLIHIAELGWLHICWQICWQN